MTEPSKFGSLLKAAKDYWWSFLPAWIFPIWMMVGALSLDMKKTSNLLAFFVVMGLLSLWGLRVSRKAYTENKFSHYMFWQLVFPFLIWIGLGFSLCLLSMLVT